VIGSRSSKSVWPVHKEFPTPNAFIGTIPRAIEDETEERFVDWELVIASEGGEMCEMVWDSRYDGSVLELPNKLVGMVARVVIGEDS
jgi:hypothetical protein